MSYTMTLDVPEKTADYAYRQGPRLSRELNAIFVAIIQAKMLCEDSVDESEKVTKMDWPKSSGTSIARRLAGVAKNVVIEDDHGILARAMMEKYERISKRTYSWIPMSLLTSCKSGSLSLPIRLQWLSSVNNRPRMELFRR